MLLCDDTYTEELLTLHYLGVEQWVKHYERHKDMFSQYSELIELWHKAQDIEARSNDKNRYKNRGCTLLEEEKMRLRVEKRTRFLEGNLK